MNTLPNISEAEYEVMKVIWKYAPINTRQVVEKLAPVSNWSPKTIQTLSLIHISTAPARITSRAAALQIFFFPIIIIIKKSPPSPVYEMVIKTMRNIHKRVHALFNESPAVLL